MNLNSLSVGTCESCSDMLKQLNYKLVSITDNELYNSRFELDRKVDWCLFDLLVFYKTALEDIYSGNNCDCYTTKTRGDNVHPAFYPYGYYGKPWGYQPGITQDIISTPINVSRLGNVLTVENIVERVRELINKV